MIRPLLTFLVILTALIIGFIAQNAVDKSPTEQPDMCREASIELYGRIGAMFDQITKDALAQGGYTGVYQVHSDGEIFPSVWQEFVTACVPPPTIEGGAG